MMEINTDYQTHKPTLGFIVLSALTNSRNKARWKSIPTIRHRSPHWGSSFKMPHFYCSDGTVEVPLQDISLSGLKDMGFMAQCHSISPLLRVKRFAKLVHIVTHSWDNSNAAKDQHVNMMILRNQQEFLALSNYFPATDLNKSSLQTKSQIKINTCTH